MRHDATFPYVSSAGFHGAVDFRFVASYVRMPPCFRKMKKCQILDHVHNQMVLLIFASVLCKYSITYHTHHFIGGLLGVLQKNTNTKHANVKVTKK